MDVSYKSKRCADCVHFVSMERTADMLGQPTPGTCRESLRAVAIMVPGGGMQALGLYPVIHEEVPACSRHTSA